MCIWYCSANKTYCRRHASFFVVVWSVYMVKMMEKPRIQYVQGVLPHTLAKYLRNFQVRDIFHIRGVHHQVVMVLSMIYYCELYQKVLLYFGRNVLRNVNARNTLHSYFFPSSAQIYLGKHFPQEREYKKCGLMVLA